jgi:hypothetical protein
MSHADANIGNRECGEVRIAILIRNRSPCKGSRCAICLLTPLAQFNILFLERTNAMMESTFPRKRSESRRALRAGTHGRKVSRSGADSPNARSFRRCGADDQTRRARTRVRNRRAREDKPQMRKKDKQVGEYGWFRYHNQGFAGIRRATDRQSVNRVVPR